MRRFVQAFTADAVPPALPRTVAHALADAPARYNIAVRKQAVVIFDSGEGLRAGDFDWGLVPSWSKTPDTKYTTVTARLERAPRSRIFRRAWEKRRCVVPMNGYYKWDRSEKPGRPYFIQAQSGELLFAAGLWDRWPADEPQRRSFAILTAANPAIPPPLVADGPVFLPAGKVQDWIEGPWFPMHFLTQLPQPLLHAYPVSSALRSREVDDYTLLEPVDPSEAEAHADAGDEDEYDADQEN